MPYVPAHLPSIVSRFCLLTLSFPKGFSLLFVVAISIAQIAILKVGTLGEGLGLEMTQSGLWEMMAGSAVPRVSSLWDLACAQEGLQQFMPPTEG